MRFFNSFSQALVGALLATSALSELTTVVRSDDNLGLSAHVDKRAETKLAKDPRSAKTKAFIQSYCTKAYKKKGKRELVARAQPAGYTPVGIDAMKVARPSDPGLWTGGIGTCVGIAVVGETTNTKAYNKFLMHLTLGTEWKHIQDMLTQLYNSVQGQGLRNIKVTLAVVDVTLALDPENKNDPYLKGEAASSGPTYLAIENYLASNFGRVTRKKHGYGSPGELQIDPNGSIK